MDRRRQPEDWVGWMWAGAERAARLTHRAWLRLPGARFADHQMRRIEEELLWLLRERLERIAPPEPGFDGDQEQPQADAAESAAPGPVGALDAIFSQLMERSRDEPEALQRAALFRITLRQLIPDHVRILAALSDGTLYPMINIVARAPLVGRDSQVVACNISSVGRAAGVVALSLVPHYIAQLRQLGLVEEGVEAPSLLDKYEILETDDTVLRAFREIEQARGLKAHVQRRTLRISSLGREFWSTCHDRRDDVLEVLE